MVNVNTSDTSDISYELTGVLDTNILKILTTNAGYEVTKDNGGSTYIDVYTYGSNFETLDSPMEVDHLVKIYDVDITSIDSVEDHKIYKKEYLSRLSSNDLEKTSYKKISMQDIAISTTT